MSAGNPELSDQKNGLIYLQIADELRDEVIHCNQLEEERKLTQAALTKCISQLLQSSDKNMQRVFMHEANQILSRISNGSAGFSVDAFLIIKKMAAGNRNENEKDFFLRI